MPMLGNSQAAPVSAECQAVFKIRYRKAHMEVSQNFHDEDYGVFGSMLSPPNFRKERHKSKLLTRGLSKGLYSGRLSGLLRGMLGV